MTNFIHISTTEPDVEMLFGPQDYGEEFCFFWNRMTLEECAVYIGAFPSRSQARKNGFSGPIPMGFAEHTIGKRKFWTFIPIKEETVNVHENFSSLRDERESSRSI